MLDFVERIPSSVELPFTADFEGGFAAAPEQVIETVRRIFQTVAVGINFEDPVLRGKAFTRSKTK